MYTSMEENSLKFIQELVIKDLNILESSNLNQANSKKYQEFRDDYISLQTKIAEYQTIKDLSGITMNANTILALKWEYASISSKLDFYMGFLGGKKNVLDYQIKTIKENIEKIVKNLNKKNYKQIKEELEEAIKLYNDILSHAINTKEITDVITEVNYQIYKYMIEDYIIPKDSDVSLFVPLIYRDMEEILKSNNVTSIIKREINKYFLNASLVKNNFNKLIILINLASNNPNINDKELEKILNRKLYKEEDIKVEYAEIEDNLISSIKDLYDSDIEKFYVLIIEYCKLHNIDKKYTATLLLASISKYYRNYSLMANILFKYNYSNIKFLIEMIICYFCNDALFIISHLRYEFKQLGKDYSYEIDCAIIAHKEKIDAKELVKYAIENQSGYLINYILTSNNLRLLIPYYLRTKDSITKEKIIYLVINNLDNTNYYMLNDLSISDFKAAFLSFLKNKNVEEIEAFLSYFKEENSNRLLEAMILEEEFALFFNYEWDKFGNSIIPKQLLGGWQIDNYTLYNNWNNIPLRTFDFNKYIVDSFNVFIAYLVSKSITSLDNADYSDFLYFIKKFYKYKLDWVNLSKVNKENGIDDINFYKYFCLGDRQEFIKYYKKNNIYFKKEFFIEIINIAHDAIIDLIEFIDVDDILLLDKNIQNRYVALYQKKLVEQGISLKEQITKVLSKKVWSKYENSEITYLLAYLIITGEFNETVLSFINNFINNSLYFSYFVKAVAKCKNEYMKPYYVLKIYEMSNSSMYILEDIIFMDREYLQKLLISDDELSKLKLKKYYGDLLKLIPFLDENKKKMVVLEIVKSNILEYILYIKDNYSEFIDLMLDNISDIETYKQIKPDLDIEDMLRLER